PDYPENHEDWPFFWGQNEYVVNLGASYIFLVHAAEDVLPKNRLKLVLWSWFFSHPSGWLFLCFFCVHSVKPEPHTPTQQQDAQCNKTTNDLPGFFNVRFSRIH